MIATIETKIYTSSSTREKRCTECVVNDTEWTNTRAGPSSYSVEYLVWYGMAWYDIVWYVHT